MPYPKSEENCFLLKSNLQNELNWDELNLNQACQVQIWNKRHDCFKICSTEAVSPFLHLTYGFL